ncbi:MAG: hypothetical protein COV59_02540 [Candidatus Magasanikbacteria bacterium CG11_big_fil_rev_8_21_14_0_20_39_34]|uniref:Leucine-binding protein domain-containing protein n=1 Tax=Candidatus Magasanikbacteria bacterium CG11_big_fil_rev_8_21_14_0_20_39_34 TaxID=1974653 RepID=A0A2H0N560_9BACT|nr:MAG: hypothetical protein COV59_02540 [Candidatus Magasanikbacteria bacterium CG11_big_fil_rev_8_21_14_0_20_39_34]
MRKKILITLLFLIIVSVLIIFLHTKKPLSSVATTFSIGWMGPLTGDAASLGQDALKASQLAVDELNAEGGINGKQLKLIVEDTKCDAIYATTAMQKFINVDHVKIVMGGLCSGETLAAAPIAEENHVVLFSPCSSSPDITSAGDYIFRSYPSDSLQGKFTAEYVKNVLKKDKVAILYVQNPWGDGIQKVFSNEYTQLGGDISIAIPYEAQTRDLRTELVKIQNSDAQAIYFLGVTEGTLVGLKQIYELGIQLPVLGGDTWSDQAILTSPFSNGTYYIQPKENYDTEFVNKLEKIKAHTSICTPGSYNNIYILADIIKKVGNDSEKIKNALYGVQDFTGVNGPITFDQNGDIVHAEYSIKKIVSNEANFQE